MPELNNLQPKAVTKQPWWKTRWFYATGGGVLLLGAAAGVWFGVVQPRRATTGGDAFDKIVITPAVGENAFTLVATKQDAQGVDASTTFTLTAKQAIAKRDVEASLSFTPTVQFAVAEAGDATYTITPAAPLDAGVVYKAALNTTLQQDGKSEKQQFQWAFQPKTALQVEGTLPRHAATGVPRTTGIEVTFNSDGVQDFAKHFTVSPEVTGKFEQHGRTWVFVPNAQLRAATVYTVTVAGALPVANASVTLGQPLTFQFETAVASTNANDAFTYASFGRSFQSILPKEAPVLDFGYYGNLGTPKATVHRVASAAALIDALKPYDAIPTWATSALDAYTIPTTGMEKVGTYDAKVEVYDDQHILRLPSGFDAGYYLITLDVKGRTLQTVLVVSSIGAAQFVSRTDTVLWLQDLEAKHALAKQDVIFAFDGKTYTSDDKGVVRFPTPAATIDPEANFTRSYLTLKTTDGRETVLPFTPSADEGWNMWFGGRDRPTKDAYWKYLYTDRTLYHPSDTVNVWGIAKPRVGEVPKTLTLQVWQWNFTDWRGENLPFLEAEVELTSAGTFTKALPLTQLTTGTYNLSLVTADGKEIASRSFEVQTFTKPAFGIDVQPKVGAGIAGTSMEVTARTTFFDGTPAPSVRLRHSEYGTPGSEGTDVQTNEQGTVTFTEPLTQNNHRVTSQHVSVFPPDAADGDVVGSADIVVFPGQVIANLDTTRNGNQATLTVGARRVDFTKPASDYWNAYETMTSGPAVSADVEVKVIEQVMTRTKRGTRYDFIEKTTYDVYDYRYDDAVRETIDGKTNSDGIYSRTITLPGAYSRVEVRVKDSAGRYYEQSAYFGSMDDNQSPKNYRIVDTTQTMVSNAQVTYPIGGKTNLVFSRGTEAVEKRGSYLFLILQGGIQEVVITDDPTLPFTFAEEHVPNVYVTGAWFTGTSFRMPSQYEQTLLGFDSDERRLDLQVTTDKPSYAPGDKVTATVTVRDSAAQPVRARVNVSAIDEALTVIESDNTPSPLESLHTYVSTGLLQQYVSHAAVALDNRAEGGGGNGDVRKDFKDAALFAEVETGNDGLATVTFTVPDNLTSWRLTAQAVADGMRAGHVKVGVPVTKAVFGLLTTPDEFVVSDKPIVIARAYGTGLRASDDVQFTLTAPSLGLTAQRTGKAFTAQRFSMPALQVGEHELRLTVKRGEQTDTLVRKITVLGSRLTRRVTTFTPATSGQQLTTTSAERLLVGVTDVGRGRVTAALQGLQWAYGNRLERHLASRIATDTLDALHEQDVAPTTGFVPASYQQEDGGVSEVVWGSSNLQLTAFAAARHDLFDAARLRQYFLSTLSKKDVSAADVSYALLGMAYLGEPVLADLDRFLAASGITDEQRLVAALGYLALGAGEQARSVALPILETYGEVQAPYVRLKLGKTNDDYIVQSARFSIIAEGLKLPQRIGFDTYLQENFPADALTNLQRALALAAAVPVLDGAPVSVTYSTGAEPKTLAVQGSEAAYVSLTPAEAKAFTVTAVSGSAGLLVQSVEPIVPATAPHDARLGVSRTYTRLNGTGGFRQGDIVRVNVGLTLGKGILDNQFTVMDILPSGFVALPQPWNRNLQTGNGFNYPIETTGQRLTFTVWDRINPTFWYYARVVTPGSYSAEPATAQGLKSRDVVNYSGGQTIAIE